MRRRVPMGDSLSTFAERVREKRKGINLTAAHVLTAGLLLAIALLVTGIVLHLAGFAPKHSRPVSVMDMPRALAAVEPSGFYSLGLIVLLAAPVARVVALAVGFGRRRSWLFCTLSVLVFVVLLVTTCLGLLT